MDELDSVQLEMDDPDDDDIETASEHRRRYQSRGVTAGASAVSVGVPVAESMLTLLLQLFRRFSHAGVYRLSLLATQSVNTTESRVGDAEFFIRRLLDRICAESMECADVINSLSKHLSALDDDSTQPVDAHQEDKAERQYFISVVDRSVMFFSLSVFNLFVLSLKSQYKFLACHQKPCILLLV